MKVSLKMMDTVIAKMEGKKRQTTIGNVREVRKLVIQYLRDTVKSGNAAGVADLLGLTPYLVKDLVPVDVPLKRGR